MTATPKGEAMLDLILTTVRNFHRLKAVGAKLGAVSPFGGGTWGVMHSLKTGGPQTVPQLARVRPVARQHIQTIANELEQDGLIEFTENPSHKRSKLVRLTKKGEAEHAEITARIQTVADQLAEGMAESELRSATTTLAALAKTLSEFDPSEEYEP